MKADSRVVRGFAWHLVVLLLASASGQAAESRPNLLFIVIDDLRAELPSYGDTEAKVPNLEALAEAGIVFENAYANVPVCGASRASLFSGLRPSASRFIDFDARIDEDAPDSQPLHAFLKDNGYATLSLGKIIHDRDDSEDGWTEPPWLPNDSVPAGRRTGHRDYQLEENIQAFRNTGRGPAFEAADVADSAYFDGQIADRAIETLSGFQSSDRPFFLAVGFVKPHLPFTAPQSYWDLYDRTKISLSPHPQMPAGMPREANHDWGELRHFAGIPSRPDPVPDETARTLRHGYFASLSYTDAQVGRLLDALVELQLDDKTIVILLGDHGWSLGDHGLWAKHSPFDVATRTPLIVRIPGSGTTGMARGLVELVDVYPTIAELLRLEAPGHLQGESFVAQLMQPDAPGKSAVFPRWKHGQVIKTPDYAMTTWRNNRGAVTATMLFDHRADRAELINLADDASFAEIAGELLKKTEELLVSIQ